MKSTEPSAEIVEFARERGLTIGARLAFGVHGSVFYAESQSVDGTWALKGFESAECYRRERDVYLRLRDLDLHEVHGCRLPRLIDHDDVLLVIQITVVARPFVLDFAGAYLDRAPQFDDETMAEWREEKKEQFGARWRDAQIVLAKLASYGIFVVDVNANNISWGD